MKRTFKIISAVLAFVIICCLIAPAGASSAGNAAITITNPYEGIDFGAVQAYKTALHTHTNASDGDPTLKESIERHAETGFDIVATTDHGTVNYSWETENADSLIHGVLSAVGKSEGALEYLGAEGKFNNGTSYKMQKNGDDDFLVLENGRKIMRVPFGIEQNAVSANAHVNSWFTDYHNNMLTSYKDAISNVDRLGGVCVINHPGEYSKARYEIHSEDAYNPNEFSYRYHINKWAALIDKYDACIGIDVNSKGDDRTRFDRILWDRLLTKFAPNGKNVFAICSSDAHQLDKIDTGFIYALMPELNSGSLKTALQKGHFFPASHCIGNYDELCEISGALNKYYPGEAVTASVDKTVAEMKKRIDDIDSGKTDADARIGITYSVLDDKGYYTGETEPKITNVTVDSGEGTVALATENALIVRWISEGKTIAVQKADEAVFSIKENAEKAGSYIRAEVFGKGGVVYTQPFIISGTSAGDKPDIVDKGFFDFGILDCLIGIFENWGDIISRALS